MIKKLINFLVLFLPYGIWRLLKIYSLRAVFRYFKYKNILAKNKILKGNAAKHSRCFVLCNGPSVKDQNLLPLKNEMVFSVASGYLHAQYSAIKPQFHCVPQITYGVMTEDDVVAWFREMDKHLGNARLILSISEFDLIQKYQLFKNRQIYYLNLGRLFKDNESEIIDIAKIAPVVSSVPIMCLIVAMYMGYKEIYLLGTEHDSFKTNEYKYAFKPGVTSGKDFAVEEGGELKCQMYETLKSNTSLWEQYRSVKNIADCNEVSIYNATLGGALDEFIRVKLDSLFINNL